jgi:hypothetical protein
MLTYGRTFAGKWAHALRHRCRRLRPPMMVRASSRMLTYAHLCSRTLPYAHVCSRMLTYSHVKSRMLTYAHVCSHILPYAHVCRHTVCVCESGWVCLCVQVFITFFYFSPRHRCFAAFSPPQKKKFPWTKSLSGKSRMTYPFERLPLY